MKKIMFAVLVALGVMTTTTSCGMVSYAQGAYGHPGYYGYGGYGTVQATPNPNGLFVRSNNLRPSGTYVHGNLSTPYQLRWANMSVVKNGMMVYVYDGAGQLINQYDMRIAKQNVKDVFHPTGLTGKALSVEICIYGGRGFNGILVSDGDNVETYYLN